MNRLIVIIFGFLFCKSFSQVEGIVYDSISKEPLEYINIWKKNKKIGGTTSTEGKFYIDNIREKDTVMLSCLGYKTKSVVTRKNNIIYLSPDENQLDEIIIKSSKNDRFNMINNYKKFKKIRNLFFIGKEYQYKLALFVPKSEKLDETSFLKKVSFVTNNSLNNDVKMRISIVIPKEDGSPSNLFNLDKVISISSGVNENKLDLEEEKIVVSEKGFFIVFERFFTEENKLYNKHYETNKNLIEYSYQPSLGIVKTKTNQNVWWGYGGKWVKAPVSGYSEFYSLKFSEPAVKLTFSN